MNFQSTPIKIVEDKIPNTAEIDSSNNSESMTTPIQEATSDIIQKSPVKLAPPPTSSSSGSELPGLPGRKPESETKLERQRQLEAERLEAERKVNTNHINCIWSCTTIFKHINEYPVLLKVKQLSSFSSLPPFSNHGIFCLN